MSLVKTYRVGALSTNCYVIQDSATKKMAIIDPGGISAALDKTIKDLGSENFEYIILTHGHFDHIRKVKRYKDLTNAKVVINKNELDFIFDKSLNLCHDFGPKALEPFTADLVLNDGDIINLGKTRIKMLHTPGHTKGGACYICDKYLFTGDTLMKNTMGRTDLKSANIKEMANSLKRIGELKENYIIYPGHGDMSSLECEKKNNPYLRKALNDSNIY
ncbi:MAG: Hydroxyacylglutathione hydrolase GloC [Eubacteriales bacterium SKADARSKE-1]|nr:Hydroxyacylglutathione hydrolase GloC [Eubacteriales bacterium SKADARSKE-1]